MIQRAGGRLLANNGTSACLVSQYCFKNSSARLNFPSRLVRNVVQLSEGDRSHPSRKDSRTTFSSKVQPQVIVSYSTASNSNITTERAAPTTVSQSDSCQPQQDVRGISIDSATAARTDEAPIASAQQRSDSDRESESLRVAGTGSSSSSIGYYIVGATVLIASGYAYSYCKEKQLTRSECFKRVLDVINDQIDRGSEFYGAYLDYYFPVSREPLLPDRKDLPIPERVPTLVVNLDSVVVFNDKECPEGMKAIKRPGADRFFKELAQFYEIVVWSSEEFPACETLVEKWGLYQIVLGILYREQCDKVRGTYVKNLERLGRPLDRVIILDSDPRSFMMQPENGIHIRPFNGNPCDNALVDLIDFLKMAACSPDDVRSSIARFGGGDMDLPSRWVDYKEKQEKKASNRRSLGKVLMGSRKHPGI